MYAHLSPVNVRDAVELISAAVNGHRPGEPFGSECEWLSIAEVVLQNDFVATFVQRAWLRPSQKNGDIFRPLGRLPDATRQSMPRPARRGKKSFQLPPTREEEEEGAPKKSGHLYTPTSAYDLFAHEEAAKLRRDGKPIMSETWTALAAAWRALSPEKEGEYKQRLLDNASYANARVATSRCTQGPCGSVHPRAWQLSLNLGPLLLVLAASAWMSGLDGAFWASGPSRVPSPELSGHLRQTSGGRPYRKSAVHRANALLSTIEESPDQAAAAANDAALGGNGSAAGPQRRSPRRPTPSAATSTSTAGKRDNASGGSAKKKARRSKPSPTADSAAPVPEAESRTVTADGPLPQQAPSSPSATVFSAAEPTCTPSSTPRRLGAGRHQRLLDARVGRSRHASRCS